MRTETIHELVCALMRDGKPRFTLEIVEEIGRGSNVNGIYPVLARLETEESLSAIVDPATGRMLYVWNDA